MYDYDKKTNSSKDQRFNVISKEIMHAVSVLRYRGSLSTVTVLATVLGYSSYDISRLKPF